MKKIFLFTVIALLLLGSCKKEAATLAQGEALAETQAQTNTSSSEGAVPFHIIVDESLDGVQFYNSCTNELVTLYGSDHFVYHGFYDGPDSKTIANVTVPATIRAVGESGREYIFTATLNAQEGEFSEGEFTFKFIFIYRIVAKGGGNNFFYELTHYLKVDAEGNWTVIRGEVEKTYCR
jgi:hypothetical protein